jgi:hypothetical protein
VQLWGAESWYREKLETPLRDKPFGP